MAESSMTTVASLGNCLGLSAWVLAIFHVRSYLESFYRLGLARGFSGDSKMVGCIPDHLDHGVTPLRRVSDLQMSPRPTCPYQTDCSPQAP
jgi:hypothetical protein